jgi:alanyl-tRNA synthetase
MLSKVDLMKSEHFALDFFKKNGFSRQKCKKCGNNFWAQVARDFCQDASCISYEFIGNPTIPGKLKWKTIREKYLKFFADQGHTKVNRYPVVARWKPDTLFVGASIFDFMPWVLNGSAKPPANPLVIDQPSVRFGDIDNVGLGSGRHCTQFSMMAHHCFNSPKEIYWKEKTVGLCYDFFTKQLKLPGDELTFVENLWKGGGNAGPCFEVMTKGNEIATLVFMQFMQKPAGYVPMKMKVVDTGYGLERISWASQGTPTIYDCIYPKVIDFLKKEGRVKTYNKKVFEEFCKLSSVMNVEDINVEEQRKLLVKQISEKLGVTTDSILEQIYPYHHIYRVADHTKALCFILGDGIVPANIQEGYLARLLIRRGLHSLHRLGIDIELGCIVEKHIRELGDTYPEILERSDDILKMVEVEEEKYKSNIKNAHSAVKKFEDLLLRSGKKKFDKKSFVMLYESRGLDPDIVKEHLNMPADSVTTIDVREEIRKNLEKEEGQKHKFGDYKDEVVGFLSDLPVTEKLYYDDEKKLNGEATILKIFDNLVVLDKTIFYPRGGGAEPDVGNLEGSRVLDVENKNGVIVHTLDTVKGLQEGQIVGLQVDKKTREGITRHHTATHVVNTSSRRVLGEHVWQEGTKKDFDKAYLNVTHYEMPSVEQVKKIEKVANDIIKKKVKVIKSIMGRTEAERKYGFRIYQGGAVPGRDLRIVNIDGWDIEACGGLHIDNTSEIGRVLITKVDKPHDGVIRFIFRVGEAADKWELSRKELLNKCGKLLKVKPASVPTATGKLFVKWKLLRKKLEIKKQKDAKKMVKGMETKKVGTVDLLVKEIPGVGLKELQGVSKQLSTDNTFVALLGVGDKIHVLCSAGKNVGINAGLITSKICSDLGGKGGGSPTLGQGFGVNKSKLKAIVKKIKTELII